MKKSKLLGLQVVFILVAVLFFCTGCFSSCSSENEGLEIGFGHGLELDGPIVTAVKSDKTEFDIDDVTLDFYYGRFHFAPEYDGDKYEPICIGIYFTWIADSAYDEMPFEDYKNIKNFFFMKEILWEDFHSSTYGVTSKEHLLGGTYTFKHSEKFTVPKEIFNTNPSITKGWFYFFIRIVLKDKEDGTYAFVFPHGPGVSSAGQTRIDFELLGNNRVRLTKP